MTKKSPTLRCGLETPPKSTSLLQLGWGRPGHSRRPASTSFCFFKTATFSVFLTLLIFVVQNIVEHDLFSQTHVCFATAANRFCASASFTVNQMKSKVWDTLSPINSWNRRNNFDFFLTATTTKHSRSHRSEKNVEIDHLVVPPPATPREPGELSVNWKKIFSLESESFLKVFFIKVDCEVYVANWNVN